MPMRGCRPATDALNTSQRAGVSFAHQTEPLVKELPDSEALFRVAFDNAPIGMLLSGPDHRVVQANRAFCAILGYTEPELLAKTLLGLTHPNDVEPNRVLVERLLAGALDTFDLETRYIHKGGNIV
jgi:PAS domain S-box-containing protein